MSAYPHDGPLQTGPRGQGGGTKTPIRGGSRTTSGETQIDAPNLPAAGTRADFNSQVPVATIFCSLINRGGISVATYPHDQHGKRERLCLSPPWALANQATRSPREARACLLIPMGPCKPGHSVHTRSESVSAYPHGPLQTRPLGPHAKRDRVCLSPPWALANQATGSTREARSCLLIPTMGPCKPGYRVHMRSEIVSAYPHYGPLQTKLRGPHEKRERVCLSPPWALANQATRSNLPAHGIK